MKLKSLVVVGLLGLASCANQDDLFRITKFFPLGDNCAFVSGGGDFITGNGYLDVAAGNPTFAVGTVITGAQNVTQQPITVNGVPIEQGGRNKPLVTSMVVTYPLSKKLGPAPKPYIQPLNLPFSEAGTITAPIQLISPELGQLLFDGLTPVDDPADDFVDIKAIVEFKGEYSGDRAPFSTGSLTYPIRAYRSNPAACTGVPYVQYKPDPTGTTNGVDPCAYVGAQPHQFGYPAEPTCCMAGTPGC